MVIKRAKGRPRKEARKAKTKHINTRVLPAIEEALAEAAEARGCSKSRMIEIVFNEYFQGGTKDKTRARILSSSASQAAADIVAFVATEIEIRTGRTWRNDRFSFEAFSAALSQVFAGIAPEGTPSAPQAILDARMKHWDKPEGLADSVAGPILFRLHPACDLTDRPEDDIRTKHADEYYLFPHIRQALGLGGAPLMMSEMAPSSPTSAQRPRRAAASRSGKGQSQ